MDTVSCKKPHAFIICNDSVSLCTFVVMDFHQGAVSDVIFLCDSVNSLTLHKTSCFDGVQIR